MKKPILLLVGLVVLAVIAFGAYQIYVVRKAHSTFENYYAFRGCSQLLSKTTDSATCELPSGKIITIVEYEGKWYLDGDLPCPGPFFSPAHVLCLI